MLGLQPFYEGQIIHVPSRRSFVAGFRLYAPNHAHFNLHQFYKTIHFNKKGLLKWTPVMHTVHTYTQYEYNYIYCDVIMSKYMFLLFYFTLCRASTSACFVALPLISHWCSTAATCCSTLAVLLSMVSKSPKLSFSWRPILYQREVISRASKYSNTSHRCWDPTGRD